MSIPTEEDNKRVELYCELATDEPWRQTPQSTGAINSKPYAINIEYKWPDTPVVSPVCQLRAGFVHFEADADFIVSARTDLPRYLYSNRVLLLALEMSQGLSSAVPFWIAQAEKKLAEKEGKV